MKGGSRMPVKVDGVVPRKVAGETILVPISSKLANLQRVFALNPVAEHIWERLDGATTVAEIRDSVVEAFEVEAAQAEKDVEDFVAELVAEGLVAEGS